MERLIVFLGAVLTGVLTSLLGRRGRSPASPAPPASVPAAPTEDGRRDGTRACVRCGAGGDAVQLIPTPEGFLCPACYDEAK